MQAQSSVTHTTVAGTCKYQITVH